MRIMTDQARQCINRAGLAYLQLAGGKLHSSVGRLCGGAAAKASACKLLSLPVLAEDHFRDAGCLRQASHCLQEAAHADRLRLGGTLVFCCWFEEVLTTTAADTSGSQVRLLAWVSMVSLNRNSTINMHGHTDWSKMPHGTRCWSTSMSLLSRALELSSLCIDVCDTPQCDTASKSCYCRRPAGLFGSTRYLRGESKSAEFPSTAMRSWDICGYRSELMPVGGALHAGIEARSRAAGLSQVDPRSDRSLGLRSRVELRRSSRLPEAPQTATFAHVHTWQIRCFVRRPPDRSRLRGATHQPKA